MKYARTKQWGLIVTACLTGAIHTPPVLQPPERNTPPAFAHITHGLRAYLDPDTGRFARPDELPAPAALPLLLSANTGALPGGRRHPPIERPSGKPAGGYAIDLRDRFRPNRHSP